MASRFQTSASLISVGQVYGKWTVIKVQSPSSLCRCACGKEGLLRNSWMVSGRIKGGCHTCANRRTRPGRRTFDSKLPKKIYGKLSALVRNVISRCTDPEHIHWDYYGGRGITVQDSWLENPSAFIEYLTTLDGFDDPTLVIDRRDNNQGYAEGNLRFVTKSESQRNKGPYKRRIHVG